MPDQTSSPAQAPTLSAHLKQATQSEHDRIEASLALPDSIRTLDDYIRLLRGFHGFYEPLERALASIDWHQTGLAMSERWKTPLLVKDLRACGHPPSGSSAQAPVPACRDLADAFGCLYVLEGATLGGAVVHRHLSAQLGDALAQRDHFYRCYGDGRGAMWRHFKQSLDAFGAHATPEASERTVVAARATFTGLREWLERR